MSIDIKDWKVNKEKCPTCPFRTDESGRHPDSKLVAEVQVRCLTVGSQICHHPRLNGKAQHSLCRGARDYQLEVFYRAGVIPAPTDEAWKNTWKQIQQQESKS